MLRFVVVAGALAAIAAAAAWKYEAIRTDLASRRSAIAASWTQVEAAMQRRAELVSGLAGKNARAAAACAEMTRPDAPPRDKIAANRELEAALPGMTAAAAYDARLRDDLAAAGQRFAVERRKYNDAVRRYNIEIELFPNNLVARLSGFPREDAYVLTGPEE